MTHTLSVTSLSTIVMSVRQVVISEEYYEQ